MNGKMNANNNGEVFFSDLIAKIWVSRRAILIWCVCGAVLGLLIGLSTPDTYEAKVSFAPETEAKLGSGVSSIASMMGVSIDNSVDAISVEMFPDVLSSTPFVYELLNVHVETMDGELKTTLRDYMENHQKQSWLKTVIDAPFKLLDYIVGKETPESDTLLVTNLPRKTRKVVRYFRENTNIEMDKKTGKTTISLTMQDPLVASTVLDVIVTNLKTYMCDYRSSKDRQDVENLMTICNERREEYYDAQKAYADFVDKNKNLVTLKAQAEQLKLQQEMQLAYQVYTQVATQLEGARIKEQQAKPVFVILEPVSLPLMKSNLGKIQLMILFTFLGGFMGMVWILFGKGMYAEIKSVLSQNLQQ